MDGEKGECIESKKNCEMLRKSVCDKYQDSSSSGISGLVVVDSPCFFNGPANTEEKLCVSKQSVISEGCGGINTNDLSGVSDISERYCDDAKLLFRLTNVCSWIMMEDKSMCVKEKAAEKCSFYQTGHGCTVTSNNQNCAWIKAENEYKCINENSAVSCDMYKTPEGCKETINGLKCVWTNVNGVQFCIPEYTADRCEYYTTIEGCTRTRNNNVCSWIKYNNNYTCIIEKTAELCEYYMTESGCTTTTTGDLCTWNLVTGKCSGDAKPCDAYISYSLCTAVNDRCFWNGIKLSSNGLCLPLENEYNCSDLSMTLCNSYGSIDGLFILDSPCFFNGPANENEFHCVSTNSMMNSVCSNVKTNAMVDSAGGPKFCTNAQLLFKINGDNEVGCMWNASNGCVSLSLEDVVLPESCSEYKNAEDCNYHMTYDKKECFWNPSHLQTENACTTVEDVENCSVICTNDISGIDSRFCQGNAVFTESTAEMCKWSEKEEVIDVKTTCNCEGITMEENCTLLDVTSPSDCKKFVSKRDSCFFNGNINTHVGEVKCTDIDDVTECEFFHDSSLCIYARKSVYRNLELNSSASTVTFLCLWNTQEEICQSKKLGRAENNNESKKRLNLVLIIVISVLVVIVVSVVIVIVFIIKKVKAQKNRIKAYEMSSFHSESSGEKVQPSGFFFLCVCVCIF
jgi:hypothetical protein